MAKITRKYHDPMLIYISWLAGEEEESHRTWVDAFYDKMRSQTRRFRRCKTSRTGDEELGAVKNPEALLNGVTDIVAVLTNKYVVANQEENSPAAKRELARFFALRLQDKSDTRRAWITPLQKFTFKHVEVGGITLSEDRFWLVRLKETGQKFPPPSDAHYDDAIYEAVDDIIGDVYD